jgi:hypothetical protein
MPRDNYAARPSVVLKDVMPAAVARDPALSLEPGHHFAAIGLGLHCANIGALKRGVNAGRIRCPKTAFNLYNLPPALPKRHATGHPTSQIDT